MDYLSAGIKSTLYTSAVVTIFATPCPIVTQAPSLTRKCGYVIKLLHGSLAKNWTLSLHERSWILSWIKTISNELDITIHVAASQLYGHRGVISNRLWRYQLNENRASETRGRYVKIVVFIVIYASVMSCKKLNNACTLVTNCFCTHLGVILVFIINTKITLSWALKQFVTRVHRLFSIYPSV